MSSRLTRTLLKLYPRRIRGRYGDELLDLEDELWARGELSRGRLLRDMILGALVIRRGRRRTGLLIGAMLVVVGLAVAGSTVGGHGADPPARHHATRVLVTAGVPVVPAIGGDTCFVAAGSSCSLTPCTELIGQSSPEITVARDTPPATRRRLRPAGSHCAASTRVGGQATVFVSRQASPARHRR